MVSVLVLGFLLGVRHALDADHVAAVAALATRSTSLRDTMKMAAAWGTGHAITLLVAVSLMIAAGAALPPAWADFLELPVGVILIWLGIGVLRRAAARGVHLHVHRHGAAVRHVHVHAHADHAHHDEAAHQHQHVAGLLPRAVFIGSVHGLAGSAVLILVWLQTIRSGLGALAYVALFGLGTILGMLLFSIAISLPLRYATRLSQRAVRGFEVAVGLVTLAIGVKILADVALSMT